MECRVLEKYRVTAECGLLRPNRPKNIARGSRESLYGGFPYGQAQDDPNPSTKHAVAGTRALAAGSDTSSANLRRQQRQCKSILRERGMQVTFADARPATDKPVRQR